MPQSSNLKPPAEGTPLTQKHDGLIVQQILTRTAEYDMLATPNFNGDRLSDARAARWAGWEEAAGLIERALETAILQKRLSHDLARQMPGATQLKTSASADAVVSNIWST